MVIIMKMTLACIAVAFWALVLSAIATAIPRTEGTLIWCQTNNAMEKSICAPYSIKSKARSQ